MLCIEAIPPTGKPVGFLARLFMTMILFALLLSVIILIHEAGHLLAAKRFGVYCYEFSFGMGPLLWKYQGKETQYSIRLLPIGGYVMMAGEGSEDLDGFEEIKVNGRRITDKPILQRIIIMGAGIAMNLLLCVISFSIYAFFKGGASVNLINCWAYGFQLMLSGITATFKAFGNLFVTHDLNQMSGPVGIYEITDKVVKRGVLDYIFLLGNLSLSVGIMNSLPLPILDGGQIVALVIEGITKKKMDANVKEKLFRLSWAIMIALAITVTMNDLGLFA